MPISFHCETCRRSICVPDGSEGKKTRCSYCASIVRVPFSGSATVFTTDDPLAIPDSDDPLGIKDPENVRPLTSLHPSQQDNPFAATREAPVQVEDTETIDHPLPGISPKKFKQYRYELRLCATVLMVLCGMVLFAMVIGMSLEFVNYLEGTRDVDTLYAVIGSIPLVFAHLGTILGLNEARQMRNLRLAWVGFILSLIPIANYSVCLFIPVIFSIWGMQTLKRDEIIFAFDNIKEMSTPD